MTDKLNFRTIIHDDVSVKTTDEGARVIEQLTRTLGDSEAALAAIRQRHAADIAALDKQLGARDAEIARLKDASLQPDAIDQMVSDRAAVIGRARSIAADLDVTGMTDADIRRAAVAARLGDDKLAGKSDDYVEALFDNLAADADPLRDAIKNQQTPAGPGAAYTAYANRLANAWKPKEAH